MRIQSTHSAPACLGESAFQHRPAEEKPSQAAQEKAGSCRASPRTSLKLHQLPGEVEALLKAWTGKRIASEAGGQGASPSPAGDAPSTPTLPRPQRLAQDFCSRSPALEQVLGPDYLEGKKNGFSPQNPLVGGVNILMGQCTARPPRRSSQSLPTSPGNTTPYSEISNYNTPSCSLNLPCFLGGGTAAAPAGLWKLGLFLASRFRAKRSLRRVLAPQAPRPGPWELGLWADAAGIS